MTKPDLSEWNNRTSLPELFIQQYERYLPTAFDGSMTMLEKMNKIIHYLNEIGALTQGILDKWLEVMKWILEDGVREEVNKQLQEWLESGLLFSQLSYVNVLIYGADNTKQNGTSTEIQKAFDFIDSQGGGKAYVPSGDYLIDKKLILPENFILELAHGATFWRAHSGGFFQNFKETDTHSLYDGRSNITLTGGTYNNNYNARNVYPTTAVDMGIIAHMENLLVENVEFVDNISYHCLDLNAINGATIRNCKFRGSIVLDGDTIPTEAIQIAEVQLDTGSSNDYTPCINITVENCYFGKSDTLGSFEAGVGNHYSRFNKYCDNITVQGCTFEDIKQMAVRPYKWTNVTIDNNTFTRCKVGVQISAPSGNTESSKYPNGTQSNLPQAGFDYKITNNRFYDFVTYGIYSSGQYYDTTLAAISDIHVSGNTFDAKNTTGDNAQCISFIRVKNVFIEQNKMFNARRGVWGEGVEKFYVRSNEMDSLDTEAVFIEYDEVDLSLPDSVRRSKKITLSDNDITNVKRNGLFVRGTRYLSIKENNIYDPGTEPSNRGGIYVETSQDGSVEDNRVHGTVMSFAVNVKDTCTDINIFNTKGNGQVFAGGTNFIGHYGTDANDNIKRIVQKG